MRVWHWFLILAMFALGAVTYKTVGMLTGEAVPHEWPAPKIMTAEGLNAFVKRLGCSDLRYLNGEPFGDSDLKMIAECVERRRQPMAKSPVSGLVSPATMMRAEDAVKIVNSILVRIGCGSRKYAIGDVWAKGDTEEIGRCVERQRMSTNFSPAIPGRYIP